LGARWRSALRTAWLGLVEDGWRVAGFTRDGRYEMERG
jgi:predicted GNAT superfamily acetyltransferase